MCQAKVRARRNGINYENTGKIIKISRRMKSRVAEKNLLNPDPDAGPFGDFGSGPDPDFAVLRIRIPCVFWPPGSGSIRTRSGFGSFYYQAKVVRKNLNSYSFVAYL
jgi:hypothetical protein